MLPVGEHAPGKVIGDGCLKLLLPGESPHSPSLGCMLLSWSEGVLRSCALLFRLGALFLGGAKHFTGARLGGMKRG